MCSLGCPSILQTWGQMIKEEASPPSPESHFHTLDKAGASKIKIYFFLGNESTSEGQKYTGRPALHPLPSSVSHLIWQSTQGQLMWSWSRQAVQYARSHSLYTQMAECTETNYGPRSVARGRCLLSSVQLGQPYPMHSHQAKALPAPGAALQAHT